MDKRASINLKIGAIKKANSQNINRLTKGQKAADWVTKWAGSWYFITAFFIFIGIWMIVNTTWIIFGRAWDIYPFILLNLVLSCLAAVQAPVILMSQNRAAERDRQRAEYDYAVNRKAEREISEIQKQLSRIEKKI
jgi:uncharacterized membrane protein